MNPRTTVSLSNIVVSVAERCERNMDLKDTHKPLSVDLALSKEDNEGMQLHIIATFISIALKILASSQTDTRKGIPTKRHHKLLRPNSYRYHMLTLSGSRG
jgi:hypothetical protein